MGAVSQSPPAGQPAEHPAGQAGQRSGARQPAGHGNPALGDIVRSVVALAVVLLLVVWVAGWFRTDRAPEQLTVDYRAAAEDAASDAPYALLVPDSLPAGWRATRATWDPLTQRWHLGVLTADDASVGVEQSASADPDDLVAAYAPDASVAGAVQIAGRQWRLFTDAEADRTTLVRRGGGAAVLVTGSVSRDEVTAFAAGLVPVDGEAVESPASAPLPSPTANWRRHADGSSDSRACCRQLHDQGEALAASLSSGELPGGVCAASRRARAPSSRRSQTRASSSPRSHRASDSSSVVPPVSSRWTTSTSSSRACS